MNILVLLMDPPLVPGLLPVQDQQEVLQLRQTELLPLDLAGIVLLEDKLLGAVRVIHPEQRQHQRLLFLIQSAQFQS